MSSAQAMFVALLGRPADPAGLAWFNELTRDGTDYSNLSGLASLPEFRSQFVGPHFDYDGEYINTFYLSMFNRMMDDDGYAYFRKMFLSENLYFGSPALPAVGIAVMEAAQGEDRLNFEAKISVAERFTARLDTAREIAAYTGNTAAGLAHDFLATVDHNHIPTDGDIDAFIARMSAGLSLAATVGTAAISTEIM